MAFGITKEELRRWKEAVLSGQLAFLTHYWLDPRFPGVRTVTKAGCADMAALTDWCRVNGLNPRYIHNRPPFPHFDLIGPKQKEILLKHGLHAHIERFGL